MKIYSVNDNEFKQFGRVLNIDATEIINVAGLIEKVESGSKYLPSVEAFDQLEIKERLQNEIFGQLPMQLGYCWGYNDTMNALEWHTCSEVNVATEDLILLLGDRRDIEEDNKYDSAKIKAFLLKKGEVIEVYATTMHFCPIHYKKENGFGCVVGLIKGTNTPLNNDEIKVKPLFSTNKWLIAHKENQGLINRGVIGSIYGENHKI